MDTCLKKERPYKFAEIPHQCWSIVVLENISKSIKEETIKVYLTVAKVALKKFVRIKILAAQGHAVDFEFI